MVAIADPNLGRAMEILQTKLQGPHTHFYTECELFSSYQDAIAKGNIDVAFIGKILVLVSIVGNTIVWLL